MYSDDVDSKYLDKLEEKVGAAGRLKAIEDFLTSMPRRLDDACDAGRVGDVQAVGIALIRIREAANHVGATELRDLAECIEGVCRRGAREVVLPMLVQLHGVMHHAEDWMQSERNALMLGHRVSIH